MSNIPPMLIAIFSSVWSRSLIVLFFKLLHWKKEERIPGLVCYWFQFRTFLPEMVLASVNATDIINFLRSHIHCLSQFEATPIHFRSYKKMGNRRNLINKCNKGGLRSWSTTLVFIRIDCWTHAQTDRTVDWVHLLHRSSSFLVRIKLWSRFVGENYDSD